MSPDQAPADLLLTACGSTRWAAAIAVGWPYTSLAELLASGETAWWGLSAADWREALAAHPRIGDRPPAGTQERSEQAGAEAADAATLAAIAAGNLAYEERFGMTYVVRAAGRDASDMLSLLNRRLSNEFEVELRIAAEQQWEITALRLAKLWGAP